MVTDVQTLRETAQDDDVRGDRFVAELQHLARPLDHDHSLDPLLERIGDARVVCLGEASHGTHELYSWRARITRRLVEEKGFDFVAVEGDWPDFERLDAFIHGRGEARFAADVLRTYLRWPTWMWANQDVAELGEWMRGHNERVPPERHIGIYGLDVYSLWDSMERVVRHLERVDPHAAAAARRAYECFAPFEGEAEQYARTTRMVPVSCEEAVARALAEVRHRAPDGDHDEKKRFFMAEQSALVARSAEHYYRTLIGGGAASWNVRDRHMADTLDRLLNFYGSSSKAIVWAHNTHVGDARYTDMRDAGEINLGQLAREAYGDEQVVLVGFSTYSGFVCAGEAWGATMETMIVPPAREGSVEEALHRVGARDALYLFDPDRDEALSAPRGHRAIGVVYRPRFERYGNYVPTILPRRYDALLHLDETRALRTIKPEPSSATRGEVPETFPSGV